MAMYDKDDRFQMQIMVVSWGDYVANLRQIAAEQKAERQRLEKEHDDHMLWVLLKMEDERSVAFRQTLVTVWRNVVEDNKKANNMTDADKKIEYYRMLHKANVRQAMLKLCSANDCIVVHATFGAWREAYRDDVGTESICKKAAKHDHVMEKALLQWDDSDRQLLLHTILRVWLEDVDEQRQRDLEANLLAKQQLLQEKYEAMIKKTHGHGQGQHQFPEGVRLHELAGRRE